MAEPAGDSTAPYATGDMEVVEQISTYRFFGGLVRWGSLGVAALLLFLVLLTCAHAGLIPSVVLTLILVVGGVVLLRGGKPGAH